MRVLMTADTVGGVWTYALELARALAAHGVEVSLATMGAPLSREQREEAGRIPSLGVFRSDFKLEWMEDPWCDVNEAGEWLLHLEKRLRPDIVHLNGYAHGALPWNAPKLVVGHSCVLSWWMAVKGEAAPATWERYRFEVTRGLHAADLVIAPTQAMLNALDQFYGPLPESRVVFNGRDPTLFTPGVKEKFVFTAGRLWDEAKNIAALERIAARLPWPLYIAGEEKHPDSGSNRAEQHGNVHALGRLSNQALASWFARASVYALPARYEPFGLSALEGALAGCALVLGDIHSLREVWGEAAIFVSPDDAGALRDTLEELMIDNARRKEMASRARHRALQFSPQRMAKGYLAAYFDLLAKGTRLKQTREEPACA